MPVSVSAGGDQFRLSARFSKDYEYPARPDNPIRGSPQVGHYMWSGINDSSAGLRKTTEYSRYDHVLRFRSFISIGGGQVDHNDLLFRIIRDRWLRNNGHVIIPQLHIEWASERARKDIVASGPQPIRNRYWQIDNEDFRLLISNCVGVSAFIAFRHRSDPL